MITLTLLSLSLAAADLTIVSPPKNLQLEVEKCFLVRKTSPEFRIPRGTVLLSDDGRRAFERLSEVQGDKLRVYDFNQETIRDIQLVQTLKPVIGLTFPQYLDRQAFETNLAVENVNLALVASPDSNTVIVAHSSSSFDRDASTLPSGGVTEIDLTSPDGKGNKPIFDRSYVGQGTLKDPKTYHFLVPRQPNGWSLISSPFNAETGITLPNEVLPRRMDIDRGIVLFTVTGRGKPDAVGLWSIRSDREVWRHVPEVPEGKIVGIDDAALLQNRVVFSVMMQTNEGGKVSQSWKLFEYHLSMGRLREVGPYRLLGSSNSGKVILIANGAPQSSQVLLIWPKLGPA